MIVWAAAGRSHANIQNRECGFDFCVAVFGDEGSAHRSEVHRPRIAKPYNTMKDNGHFGYCLWWDRMMP